ncbi:MAG: DUF4340 domain-containing protein [Saprospiraceae bacterium]|nr:DUF4340 domain-containing protein [Saprospiraceae bacterium]
MKNKHLIFLFLSVVALGVLIRQVPLQYRSFFRSALIQIDTAGMDQCRIQRSGRPDLALDRTENGWVAEQEGRSSAVPALRTDTLLSILSAIHSLRTVKTNFPDSLGFSAQNTLRVWVYQETRLVEHFELGTETLEADQPVTFLRLPLHEGVYVVPGHLRQQFNLGLDDLRPQTLVQDVQDPVARFALQTPGTQPVFFEKSVDSTRWVSLDGKIQLSADSVQTWLNQFQRLNASPFADHFDESQANETRLASIRVEHLHGHALLLDFFYLKPPETPEDLSTVHARNFRSLPVYVVHSSENPLNYFAAADTNLVRFLCFGLWRPPLTAE